MNASAAPAAPAPARSARHPRAARQRRRLIAAHVHVSAALLLATALLWKAGAELPARRWWELGLAVITALSAASAFAHALLPWLADQLPPRIQRAGIWQAFLFSIPAAVATVTSIGFPAVGACQLLLVAAILAEVGDRQRVLLFLWAVAGTVFLAALWHVHDPLV